MDDIDMLEDLMFIKLLMEQQAAEDETQELAECSNPTARTFVPPAKILPPLFESTRMNCDQFETVLLLVEPFLKKESRRKPIDAELRLFMTLHYLAHGLTFLEVSMEYEIGLETARNIIYETCDVLWSTLHPLYMPPPHELDWIEFADKYYESTGLPNCIGVIDGRHIKITCPPVSGAKFENHKTINSIVLLAICDSDYVFHFVDCETYGRKTNGGVFRRSSIGKKIYKKQMDIPAPTKLPESDVVVPYYFAASGALPLHSNIMKPYAGIKDRTKLQYNRRIAAARTSAETAFGMLTTKWEILKRHLQISPTNCQKIILATVVLHNFLRLDNSNPNAEVPDAAKLTADVDLFALPTVKIYDADREITESQKSIQFRDKLSDFLNQHAN